VVENLRSNSR